MAARPSVSKIPPKKLQPSKWPFPVSGSGSGTAVLGVGLEVDIVVVSVLLVAVVVVGVVVVVVGIVEVVVSGIGVVIVVVVVVIEVVVVVSVVVDTVVVVVSAGVVVVVSEELVVVVVSAGVVVMIGSSPDPEQSSVVLNSLGVTGSEETASVTSWQVSEVSWNMNTVGNACSGKISLNWTYLVLNKHATSHSHARLTVQAGLAGRADGGAGGGRARWGGWGVGGQSQGLTTKSQTEQDISKHGCCCD